MCSVIIFQNPNSPILLVYSMCSPFSDGLSVYAGTISDIKREFAFLYSTKQAAKKEEITLEC